MEKMPLLPPAYITLLERFMQLLTPAGSNAVNSHISAQVDWHG